MKWYEFPKQIRFIHVLVFPKPKTLPKKDVLTKIYLLRDRCSFSKLTWQKSMRMQKDEISSYEGRRVESSHFVFRFMKTHTSKQSSKT